MQSSRDDVSSSSDNEQMNEQEAALKVAYDRYSNAISKLFDLAEDSSNQELCEEIITMMRNVMDNLTMLTPSEGWVGKKGPYDFQVTADWLAYSERWYGEGKTFSENEALEEADDFKHSLESGEVDNIMAEERSKLVGLFTKPYQKAQVELHCAELRSALSAYVKVALSYYFNNNPYDHGKELVHGVEEVCKSYCIDSNARGNDIFEETLLKMSGVTTQPNGCRYHHIDPETLLISVKGISQEDAEKFHGFLRESTGDSDASFKYVAATDENKTDRFSYIDAYQFSVDIKKAKENLLPKFVEEIERLAYDDPALLDKYVDKKSILRENDVDAHLDAFGSWAWSGACSAASSVYSFFAGPAGSPAVSPNRTPEPTPENSPATPRR